ncbi:hypothetical protein BB560_006664 [Smittium megazygosporum]|uniref:Transmembrane protein 198 n=1 Tax=Smittium megazygosporum TaxID=133381 RepID=A0A2T9Y2N2_9FUNG|nr:hypothetical protein BB560_006664 [Smittium megazygosporum]
MLVSEIILAVAVFIPFGLFVAFFSNKYFRITSFFVGFLICEQTIATLGYQIATNYNNAVVPVVAILVGLILALGFIIIPVVGFASTGAMIGYSVAKFCLLQANKNVFVNSWVNFLYLFGISLLFTFFIFFEEYGVYVIGTAFLGGMMFVSGVDVFAQTGLNVVILSRFDPKIEFLKTNGAWGLICAWIWITILGSLFQNRFFNEKVQRNNPLKLKMFSKRRNYTDEASV